jgi:hypothetical protein
MVPLSHPSTQRRFSLPRVGSLAKTHSTSYRRDLRRQEWFPVLQWVLAHQLAPGARCPLTAPLDAPFWDTLLSVVSDQRIAGHLAAAIDAGLPVTAAQREAALSAHRAAVMADLGIEQAVLGLADLLDLGGIEWRLIKGLVAARLLYRDPALRSTGDVDVVIRPGHFTEAVALVHAKGGASWEYVSHGRAASEAAAARTFMHSTGIELDLHRQVRGHAGRFVLPTALLFDDPQEVVLHGRSLPVPSTPVVILHAMLHLSKGGPSQFGRVSTLADLLWARAQRGDDYQRALQLAGEVGCTTPALWADRVLNTWVPATAAGTQAPIAFADALRVPLFDRMVASSLVAGHLHRFVGPHRLRRAWEAAFPAAEFRERHDRTLGTQIRHVAVRLFTGRSPAQRPDD